MHITSNTEQSPLWHHSKHTSRQALPKYMSSCLRSGHQTPLNAYKHRTDPTQDPSCIHCYHTTEDTKPLILNCLSLSQHKENFNILLPKIFGSTWGMWQTLKVPWDSHPRDVADCHRAVGLPPEGCGRLSECHGIPIKGSSCYNNIKSYTTW